MNNGRIKEKKEKKTNPSTVEETKKTLKKLTSTVEEQKKSTKKAPTHNRRAKSKNAKKKTPLQMITDHFLSHLIEWIFKPFDECNAAFHMF